MEAPVTLNKVLISFQKTLFIAFNLFGLFNSTCRTPSHGRETANVSKDNPSTTSLAVGAADEKADSGVRPLQMPLHPDDTKRSNMDTRERAGEITVCLILSFFRNFFSEFFFRIVEDFFLRSPRTGVVCLL